MRVLVAPDRFGGALTAVHAARALSTGWTEQVPTDEVIELPMSDGSAGLLDVVHAARGGTLMPLTVSGPLGRSVPAAVLHVPGTAGGTAYVEADQALGEQLVASDQRAAAARSGTSTGLGELLRAALGTGAGRVVVGLPAAAAVHDAGAGMLAALAGLPADHPLRTGGLGLASLQPADLDGAAQAAALLAGRDVVLAIADDLPLLGLHGAGAVLGRHPDVGAGLAQELERALGHATDVLDRHLPAPAIPSGLPLAGEGPAVGAGHAHTRPAARRGRATASGAGGGAAFLLMALGARALPGADVVARTVDLAGRVAEVDLVVTGAAVLDAPSLTASVMATVGREAMSLGLPVVAVAEEVRTSRREVAQIGVSGTYEVIERRRDGAPLVAAPEVAVEALASRARRLARTWSA